MRDISLQQRRTHQASTTMDDGDSPQVMSVNYRTVRTKRTYKLPEIQRKKSVSEIRLHRTFTYQHLKPEDNENLQNRGENYF